MPDRGPVTAVRDALATELLALVGTAEAAQEWAEQLLEVLVNARFEGNFFGLADACEQVMRGVDQDVSDVALQSRITHLQQSLYGP